MVRRHLGWRTSQVDEPAECASIRAQISEAETEINDLQASRVGLDPRSPVDRAETRQINAQITSVEQRLRGLRSQRDQLGCARFSVTCTCGRR